MNIIKFFAVISVCLLFINCKNDTVNKKTGNSTVPQKFNDYIDFQYDEVIAFANVNPMDYYDGDFDKELNPKSFKDTISVKLDSVQIKELNDILSGRKSQDINSDTKIADCFYPRHNIIFLNQNKIVNHLVICFECNQVKGSKPSKASMKNYQDFFSSLGLKTFDNPIEHSTYYDSIQQIHKKKIK